MAAAGQGAQIGKESFGSVHGQPVERYRLTSAGGAVVTILTYGGIIQTLDVPDRAGRMANVTLGFAGLDGYLAGHPYFGALVGRYANRLAGGRFTLDGQTFQVPANEGEHAIHGGPGGFDKQVWQAAEERDGDAVGLTLRHISPDGAEGFPGTLDVRVTYLLSADNVLSLHYRAVTDRPTVVNLTNHAYFNLAGEGEGSIEDHILHINAALYTPVDATLIPTGEVASLAGTPLDFARPAPIGARMRLAHPQLAIARGYDHNYVLDHPSGAPASLVLAASVSHPASGRRLDVSTTAPGMQFYSGNFLDGTLVGASGRMYRQGDGFALETQHFPDAPNHPQFPSPVLRPGEDFTSTTTFAFSTEG